MTAPPAGSPEDAPSPGATASRSSSVLLAAASAGLGIAGALLLSAATLQGAATAMYQHRAARWFEETRRSASPAVPDSRGEAPGEAPGCILGRISIPRIGVDAIIVEGVEGSALDHAVGHVPGTAGPGGSGNIALAGHRDTVFRALREVAVGDTIGIQDFTSERRYRVESLTVVEPDEVGVLAPTTSDTVTLITCHPFGWIGPAPRRFVVRAVRVRGGLRARGRVAAPYAPRAQRRAACSRSIAGTQAR